MIDGLTNSGSIPTLERLMQFAGQRHRLIVNNIANLSTPGFRPVDVSPRVFQQQLAEAIDARRASRASPAGAPAGSGLFGDGLTASGPFGALGSGRAQSPAGPLDMRTTREIEVTSDQLILHPEPTGDNILFHDGTDHSVERIMQDLVENFMTYRFAAQFLQKRFDQIRSAIRERI